MLKQASGNVKAGEQKVVFPLTKSFFYSQSQFSIHKVILCVETASISPRPALTSSIDILRSYSADLLYLGRLGTARDDNNRNP